MKPKRGERLDRVPRADKPMNATASLNGSSTKERAMQQYHQPCYKLQTIGIRITTLSTVKREKKYNPRHIFHKRVERVFACPHRCEIFGSAFFNPEPRAARLQERPKTISDSVYKLREVTSPTPCVIGCRLIRDVTRVGLWLA